MKKEIDPKVAIGVAVVIALLIGFFYYRNTASPEPQAMGAQGPGAIALKKSGGDMTKFMTPAEKAMMSGGRR